MLLELFQYGFLLRGLEAGIIVAIISPLIGIFLVLRRYSLIADTLSHVSFAGIAIGLLLGVNPIFTALGASLLASLGIENLRTSRRVYGESALALFLSGSLALAIVILSFSHGLNSNLLNYLFGSILTVTTQDIYTIAILALVAATVIVLFFKELLFTTFDEDAAKIAGIPTKFINALLIILASFVISLSIPIVGVLLISALIVIPVITALQLRKSFFQTIIYAELISILSVISGIFISYYFNLSSGGTIVLTMLTIFAIVNVFSKR